jgi:hypothetical protein
LKDKATKHINMDPEGIERVPLKSSLLTKLGTDGEGPNLGPNLSVGGGPQQKKKKKVYLNDSP